MLQIKHICKEYRTGNLVQKALDHVSLNLRDNEFVAILGPSGSGKTTLLNIIGGLDRYDSGDLIINGISTKKYKDRDWDSYRNHTIGFVFQSYNLIPHQTVLSNVELALTISGIGKLERRQRALEALEKVGLGEQAHKKPNQMSGGQMQRVAIARALVNDPDILLADEPTGALDSDTSIQVMELLKEVAQDRLVVMVTHNPELAEAYATRIVNLRDGQIRADSDPLTLEEENLEPPRHENMGKSSMSFLTALSLSFNNLRTKKARTLLTAFAGSIGIIGIALILALSTGVNDYIKNVEEETLSEYPLQIQSTGLDLSSMLVGSGSEGDTDRHSQESGDIHVIDMVTSMFSTMDANDLASLKEFLDSGESKMEPYVKAIEYSYNVVPQIYRQEEDGVRQVHPDQSFSAMGLGSSGETNSMMSSMMSTDVFFEMPEDEDLYKDQYDVKAGRWPENENECVLVLTANGGMSDFVLYTLGLRDSAELDKMVQQFINEEDVEVPDQIQDYSYQDILGITFKRVNSKDYYQYDSQYQVWRDKTDDQEYMKQLVAQGEDLTIVGVVQPSPDASASALSIGIGYPASLTRHVVEEAAESEIVQEQLADPATNVFTNEAFGTESGSSNFDMDSLITVDQEKLNEAFGFDQSALSQGLTGSMDFSGAFQSAGNNLDLSGMIDLSSISVDLPQMPQVDLGELIGSLHLSISAEGLSKLTTGILEGYQAYAAEHPEADYSGLPQDFAAYLKTQEARDIFLKYLREILESNEDLTISLEQLRTMVREFMTGFQSYLEEQGYTDTEKMDQYLSEYLTTGEAQDILDHWARELFPELSNITITREQLEGLAQELASGYLNYAAANDLPDPSKMGEYFMAYLGTEDGQNRITQGLAEIVDADSLEAQIATPLKNYMQNVMVSYGSAIGQALEGQITTAMQQVMTQLSSGMEEAMKQAMNQVGESLSQVMHVDADAFADAFQMNMNGDELAELMMSMNSVENASYENNLKKLGYVDFAEPSSIAIYPLDFESKEQVVAILDAYNQRMEEEGKEEQVITYTDVVGTLMSSVTDIIDIISYVLIAFVAISLIVSSIMIGVITYISVLERKKEIGILRAIGASKGNISQVFNAETFIIGLCSGLMGIIFSLLILIPGNALIHHLADSNDVNAVLPALPAVILVALSVVLTLLGGLIPSRKAAKNDPVTALRTE